MSLFAIVALLAYSLSMAMIIPSLLTRSIHWRRLAMISATLALVCHGIAIEQRIFIQDSPYNFSLLNIGSVVSLIISAVMTMVASRNRGWMLLPFVYILSLINLALASFVPNAFLTHLETSPAVMIHIGLALFAYATLIIAAIYSLQLAWIDFQLKHKKLTFNADIPPLMTLERKMFYLTQVGVVLLTLALCSGLFYRHDLLSRENIDKAVLTIVAWLVYIVLIWGHYQQGWRGRRVIWFNCSGATLLTLAYFGSRFLQPLLSH